MRLIIDKLGNGHADLFLKFDLIPTLCKVADSYYLSSFLEIEESKLEELNSNSIIPYQAIQLIDYWRHRILSIEKGVLKFIPFELDDEYVAGFTVENTKLGYKVKLVHTQNLFGYDVDKSNLDRIIQEDNIIFEVDWGEWLYSEKRLFDNLDWSKEELNNQMNSI